MTDDQADQLLHVLAEVDKTLQVVVVCLGKIIEQVGTLDEVWTPTAREYEVKD
jgi:hypothetical protein